MRFRNAAAAGMLACAVLLASSAAPRQNLARGKAVKVFSSEETQGWTTSALTDGSRSGPGWRSTAFKAYVDHRLYPEFVVVDLGAVYRVEGVDLYPFTNGGVSQGFPEDFTIEICVPGERWRTIAEHKAWPAPDGAAVQHFAFPASDARFVKIRATKLRPAGDGYRFQLSEIEVFGTPAPVNGVAASASEPEAAAYTRAAGLRCEHRLAPLGIDTPKPRLSWVVESSVRGQGQTAYRVLVATTEAALARGKGDAWDSGRIASDQTIGVEYAGTALHSGQTYWWKVKVWDANGREIAWSEPSSFVTGRLHPEDWRGVWIGAGEDNHEQAVYLRKQVDVRKRVRRATAFYSGLGFAELYVNGEKAGDSVLSPGFTTYDKRVQYVVEDVTRWFAKPGAKVIGVILGDGWYSLEKDPWVHKFEMLPFVDKPKLLLDIELQYEDGSSAVIRSDTSWKWSYGEITYNWIAVENIDHRRAMPGWNAPGFADTKWKQAVAVKGPAGHLVSRQEPPTRVLGTIRPVSLVHNAETNTYTYFFGREFQGTVKFRTAGPAGTDITIKVLPVRNQRNSRGGYTNHFILGGNGVEEYTPRFNYNAISLVEITGVKTAPKIDDLTGVWINADLQPAGHFESSDDLLNWLHGTFARTQLNYVTGIPNDPTREKKGWVQDIEGGFRASAYTFESAALYERWYKDILDGQALDGNAPNVTPGPAYTPSSSPWWGGMIVWTPWYFYQYYGDTRLLAESYPAMERYVKFLGIIGQGGRIGQSLVQDWGIGDWLPIQDTDRKLINTSAYYLYATILSRAATVLGKEAEAAKYAKLADAIRTHFNTAFLDPETGKYRVPGTRSAAGTQSAQALALALGIVPETDRNRAAAALMEAIARHKNHISTGFTSTTYLLELLLDLNPQAGFQMTMQTDYPSWYSMTAGTDHDLMMERWDGEGAMMSALGAPLVQWNFQALGGIRPDAAAPGFKKIVIKPAIAAGLHRVECYYDSVRGRIGSNWTLRDKVLRMDVLIPANTTATVFVPAPNAGAVTESGKPVGEADGVKFLRMEGGSVVYELQSGRYRFESRLELRADM